VGELREVEAQLMVGSAWAERLRRGGFTAASSSPAFGRSGGGILGSGVGETAKERGKRFAGVLVVLMRAKDRALGCCNEPSTVAARWWPAVAFWARGTGMEALARGVEGGGELWRDAWRS
jgi:hypothetical protein